MRLLNGSLAAKMDFAGLMGPDDRSHAEDHPWACKAMRGMMDGALAFTSAYPVLHFVVVVRVVLVVWVVMVVLWLVVVNTVVVRVEVVTLVLITVIVCVSVLTVPLMVVLTTVWVTVWVWESVVAVAVAVNKMSASIEANIMRAMITKTRAF